MTGTLTAGGGSGILDPLSNPQAYDYCTIAGQQSPGLLKAIEGFSRDATWQSKSGKGSQGAAQTLVQLPPAKGALIFELWTSLHFQQWATFRQLFIIASRAGATAESQALTISHPFLIDNNITAVLPMKLHPKQHRGRGLWIVKVELEEFIPTPKASIVSTVTFSNSTPKASMPTAGFSQPTVIQKLKAQQAQLFTQLGQP